jgi:hypothetical protein
VPRSSFFWEYMFRIVGIVSLQCEAQRSLISMSSFGQRRIGQILLQATKRYLGQHKLLYRRTGAISGQQRGPPSLHQYTYFAQKAAFDKNLISWFLIAR